jgi:hypothetical protein
LFNLFINSALFASLFKGLADLRSSNNLMAVSCVIALFLLSVKNLYKGNTYISIFFKRLPLKPSGLPIKNKISLK